LVGTIPLDFRWPSWRWHRRRRYVGALTFEAGGPLLGLGGRHRSLFLRPSPYLRSALLDGSPFFAQGQIGIAARPALPRHLIDFRHAKLTRAAVLEGPRLTKHR